MKQIKKLFILFLLSIFTSSLFATEEKISKIYKEIDIIFVEKADEEFNSLLKENVDDTHYYLVENYSKKKVRRLVIDNDYEFAMTAIYIIIDNNIDGGYEDEEAIEMYSAISEAWEEQKQYELEEESLKQKQLVKKEQEKEKIRKNEEKKYIVSAENEDGEVVYLSHKETRKTDHKWSGSLGLLNFGVFSLPKMPFEWNMGISGSGLYEYILDDITFGADFFAEAKYLQINENFPRLMSEFDINVRIAINKMSKNLFFKLGFSSLNSTSSEDFQSLVVENFSTPVVGLELGNIKIGKSLFTIGADYYLGSFFDNNIKQAFGLNANFAIPFAEMEEVRLNFNIGVKDKFFIKNSGIENRATLILGFGVENVNR